MMLYLINVKNILSSVYNLIIHLRANKIVIPVILPRPGNQSLADRNRTADHSLIDTDLDNHISASLRGSEKALYKLYYLQLHVYIHWWSSLLVCRHLLFCSDVCMCVCMWLVIYVAPLKNLLKALRCACISSRRMTPSIRLGHTLQRMPAESRH